MQPKVKAEPMAPNSCPFSSFQIDCLESNSLDIYHVQN